MKRTTRRTSQSTSEQKEPLMSSAAQSRSQSSGELHKLSNLCLDPAKPPEVRAKILLDVIHSHFQTPALQQAVLADVLRQSGARTPEAEAQKLKECYEQALLELEHGPIRPATFLSVAEGDLPGPKPRVHVVTPDGQERCPVLHPRIRLADCKLGMTVYLDPKGSVVLGLSSGSPRVGQEGTFLRQVAGTTLIEATLQGERLMLHGSAPVLDAIAAGTLTSGGRILVCPRRHLALGVVPPETDYAHRFLDRSRVPDVIAERDIGKPHWVLAHMMKRLHIFLTRPDLLERFDLRPRFAVLLTGPSGCGKTLTIRAFLRAFDRALVERTGRQDLGSRVIRVRVADLLSEWLGRSDRNIEELFNDIRAIAGTTIETASGEKVVLPVVLILEEVEGIARRRGEPGAGTYDRILATLLQRLDDPTDELGKLPLLLISTSNRPDLIDSAMCRRLGLQARFTRLDREGLAAVLDKKLKANYPYAPVPSWTAEQVREDVIRQVAAWLFGPGASNAGMVEIVLDDGREILKRRRDFLTGGIVEQAVASAIDQAVFAAEGAAAAESGLNASAVIEALRQQIDALADNLTPDNAADYLDLPENARVSSLRRLRSPAGTLPFLLEDLDN
jgi:ATP-dependent 26S proteasome regulatory subunit